MDLATIGDLEKDPDAQERKCTWKLIETGKKDNPGRVSHQSSVIWLDKMFMFGGCAIGDEPKGLYSLDLKSFKWECINSRGDVPFNRDEHTAVMFEDQMVVFGGFVKGVRVNDVYKYFVKENKWEFMKPFSPKEPCPRAGHSCV